MIRCNAHTEPASAHVDAYLDHEFEQMNSYLDDLEDQRAYEEHLELYADYE